MTGKGKERSFGDEGEVPCLYWGFRDSGVYIFQT